MKKILYILLVMMIAASCGEKITDNNGNDNGTINEGNSGGENGGENSGENGEENGGGEEIPELTLEQKMAGEWFCPTLAVGGDAYLSFFEEKTFELYQKIGEGAYRLYRGTWNLEDTILTGKYNDGEDWAATYSVAIDDETMTLTSQNNAAEVSRFSKTAIPEEVKNTCVIVVKSGN